jgi:hypothetical protein
MNKIFLSLVLFLFLGVQISNAAITGSGTIEDPYVIYNCVDLQALNDSIYESAYIELANDIICTGAFDEGGSLYTDGSEGFAPIGSNGNFYFQGSFNGNDNTISGLKIFRDTGSYPDYALFRGLLNADILNLNLTDLEIIVDYSEGPRYIAGIAGWTSGASIDNVHVSGDISIINSVGTYKIRHIIEDQIIEIAEPFSPKYTTKEFVFDNLSEKLELEIVQEGKLKYAGVDSIKLNACGVVIDPEFATQENGSINIKDEISADDLNVVVSSDRPISISWDLPENCTTAIMSMNANEYGESTPFSFPGHDDLNYSFDSNIKSIILDGSISEVLDDKYTSRHFLRPTTGHPEGYFYSYISNDNEYLYISADITIDNTNDYGNDWLSAYVDGKEFRVDDFNQNYGICDFQYTNKVAYKHQVCEMKIPKSELINVDNVNITFQYYGTAGTGGPIAGIVSDAESTQISNSSFSGNINDTALSVMDSAGLVGWMSDNSSITESYSEGEIIGSGGVAGLVYSLSGSTITDSYSVMNLEGPSVGGLIGVFGINNPASVARTYYGGTISVAAGQTGAGLVDSILDGTISDSYFGGEISGEEDEAVSYVSRYIYLGDEFEGPILDPEDILSNIAIHEYNNEDDFTIDIVYETEIYNSDTEASNYLDFDYSNIVQVETDQSVFYYPSYTLYSVGSEWEFDDVWYQDEDDFPKLSPTGYVVLEPEPEPEPETEPEESRRKRSSGGMTLEGRIAALERNGNFEKANELRRQFGLIISDSPSSTPMSQDNMIGRFIFSRDLEFGMIHSDVVELQKFLNKKGYIVSISGFGSMGNETDYFGNLTRAAVIEYQRSKNITPDIGYFGPITRGFANQEL